MTNLVYSMYVFQAIYNFYANRMPVNISNNNYLSNTAGKNVQYVKCIETM